MIKFGELAKSNIVLILVEYVKTSKIGWYDALFTFPCWNLLNLEVCFEYLDLRRPLCDAYLIKIHLKNYLKSKLEHTLNIAIKWLPKVLKKYQIKKLTFKEYLNALTDK